MASMLDWQDAISDRLAKALPGTKIYLEGVTESQTHDKDPTGLIKPFVILWFGQLTHINDRAQDLCGPSGVSDARAVSFVTQIVAPTGRSLLQLENYVRGLLMGWAPYGQGPLDEGGSNLIREPFPLGIGDTLRFYKALFWTGSVTLGGLDPSAVTSEVG